MDRADLRDRGGDALCVELREQAGEGEQAARPATSKRSKRPLEREQSFEVV